MPIHTKISGQNYQDMAIFHGTQCQWYMDGEVRFEMQSSRGSTWKIIPMIRSVKLNELDLLLTEI